MLNTNITIDPVHGCPQPMVLHVTQYAHDGSTALVGHSDGKTGWTATVCIPNNPPADGCVWVKDSLLDPLFNKGVIDFTGKFERHQGEYVYECKLLA